MTDLIFLIGIPGIILAIALGLMKSPWFIGAFGEWRVKIALGKTVEGSRYVINNLMLQSKDGKTSQIDHILINKNGIFVIETKNYSGRIYGDEHSNEWTQVLNYGKVKYKLYNPIKQNATHIYRLKEVVKNKNIKYHSIIVFAKGNTEYINANNVYSISEMKQAIKNTNEASLDIDDMKRIYDQLIDIKNNSCVSLREHVDNVETMLENIEDGICPRCGGNLVERNGKNGKFYGCSNFPKCKFTKN